MHKCSIGIMTTSIILAVISGCAHRYDPNQDGAPRGHLNLSRVKNAAPKHLAKSRYGNPKSYVIAGKRYHVLKSARNYNKRGIASWYGTKFHGRLTSSREPYNMYAMTAASPELPLPTFVRVTNLENGKQIIVKVNDRGPFAKNRIIDLSYVAAKKLGVTRKGTAMVQVTAITPKIMQKQHINLANQRITRTRDIPQHPRLFLQAGAFSSAANASAREKHIRQIVQQPVHIKRKGHHYKVRIGPIKTAEQTDKIKNYLKNQGINSITVIS